MAVADPDPAMAELIEKAGKMDAATNQAGVVAIVDQVLMQLVRKGLAIHVQLPPKSVGVHPSNRYGWGVSPTKALKLGFDRRMPKHTVTALFIVCIKR